MSSRAGPPAHVPTLTEVVQPAALGAAGAAPAAGRALATDETLQTLQEAVARRVLQQVEPLLAQRLHQAIAQAVATHAQALTHCLQDEVQQLVRDTVAEAFAPEAARVPTHGEAPKEPDAF